MLKRLLRARVGRRDADLDAELRTYPWDTSCLTHYTYVMRSPDGSVRVEHDLMEEGVCPRETWLRLLRDSGFEPRSVPFNHSELEPGSYELFLATRS